MAGDISYKRMWPTSGCVAVCKNTTFFYVYRYVPIVRTAMAGIKKNPTNAGTTTDAAFAPRDNGWPSEVCIKSLAAFTLNITANIKQIMIITDKKIFNIFGSILTI